MQPSVNIVYFNNLTLEEFLASPRSHMGHRQQLKASPSGTIVVMVNLDTRSVVGVCTLTNWEGTDSPCRAHHALDADVYHVDHKSYNKYEIRIENLRMLKTPLTFDEIKMLVGGNDLMKHTNMWKGHMCNYASPFVTGDDQTPIERYKMWAKSLL